MQCSHHWCNGRSSPRSSFVPWVASLLRPQLGYFGFITHSLPCIPPHLSSYWGWLYYGLCHMMFCWLNMMVQFQTGVLMEGFGYGGVKSLRSSQSKPSSIGFRNCHNNIASKITRSAGPTFLGDSFEALQTIHLKPDRYLRSANPPAKVGY